MAKTRGLGRSPPSTTHRSSPTVAPAPPTVVSTSSDQPTPLAVASGPPFTVPGAEAMREPEVLVSSSDDEAKDPDVTFEGFSTLTSSPTPPNKRRARQSSRLAGQSGTKRHKTEQQPEVGSKTKLERFRNREIAKGMALDIPWSLDNSGEQLVNLVKNQGWEKLFGSTFKNLIYPNELAELYCNLTVKGDVCETVVKGEGFEFDADKLGEILTIPVEGVAVHVKKIGVPTLEYTTVEDLIASYSQNTCNSVAGFHQDALTPFHKLVYNLVRRSIVPRAQKRATVEVLDVVYMDLLVTGRQINFPLLMIRHMKYMQKGSNFSLPYAPLITDVLKHFNVPLKSAGTSIGAGDILGKAALENLSVEIRKGQYFYTKPVRKAVSAPLKSSFTSTEHPKEQGGSSSDVLAPTVFSVLTDLRAELLQGFEQINGRLNKMDTKVDAIVSQMVELKQQVCENNAAILKKLEEFEGTTIEQEVEEEVEAKSPEQALDPTAPTP